MANVPMSVNGTLQNAKFHVAYTLPQHTQKKKNKEKRKKIQAGGRGAEGLVDAGLVDTGRSSPAPGRGLLCGALLGKNSQE